MKLGIYCLLLILKGSLASPARKSAAIRGQGRVLDECELHLSECEAGLSNYSLPLLLYQAAFPPQDSSTVTTASKKDDKKDNEEEEEGLISQVLGGLLFYMAGDDGPVRNVVYWVNDLGSAVLHDIFVMLNIPATAFLPLVAVLPPGVLALRALFIRLYPEIKLENLVPDFNMTRGVGMAESDSLVLDRLHDVVENAQQTGTLDESNLPDLVENLYDMIFQLEPRDVAAIITLPFFVATANDRMQSKDKPDKDDKNKDKKGNDTMDYSPPDGVALLLGVPIIVLVARVMVGRLLPGLLPSNILPSFPLIDRLFFSETDADVFADATMVEVESILVDANITGAEGMFTDEPESGSAIVDLLMGRVEATVDDFEDDPVSTAVRVVATSVVTSQSVLTQFAPIIFGEMEDPASSLFELLDFNTTDPEVAGTNVREIVEGNYPTVISYGDFFVSVTKNILDTALPGYFTGDTEDQGPIQNLLGGFFESTNSCEVDLTSCQASLLLAQGLTRDLNDDESEPEMPIMIVSPLPGKDDETESIAPRNEPINMIQEQSSSTRYAINAGLAIMAAGALAT